MNTFEPGTIARNVEHFAMHPLAEEVALTEFFAYWDIESKYRSQRDDEPEEVSAEEVLALYKIYVEKYLRARIAIIPDYQQQYEKDLEGKLEHLRKWTLNR